MGGPEDGNRTRGARLGESPPVARIADYLDTERIQLEFEATRARVVLAELASLLGGNDETTREAVFDDLVAREQLSSTAVGGGIAFPHARADILPSIRIAFLRLNEPVEFHALDRKKVDLFLGVAGPMTSRREYLTVLARLSYLFRSESVRRELRAVGSREEALRLLRR